MADEAASLLVRITGDASQLEAAAAGAARSLSGLSAAGTGVSGTTQKALGKVSESTRSYADAVADAKRNLERKNAALRKTETAYNSTRKSVQSSNAALSAEKDRVEQLMKAQQGRIDRYEEMSRAAKKNSAAYKLTGEQLKKEHTAMKELETGYNDITGRIKTNNAELDKAALAYNGAQKAAKTAGEQYKTLSGNMAEVIRYEKAFRMQEIGESIESAGSAIDEATRPLQALALAAAAGGVASAKFAIDFEDNFAAVKKTVDGTPEQLEAIRQGLIDLTTVGIDGRNPLPMATAALTELAAAGGQLGIQTENILEFTEVMAQMGTATNLSGEAGAQAMARFMNVMQESQRNVRNVGSAVVDLGNNMATTEAEIISMSNRMGKYGNTVGMGTADVLGYSAALSSLGIEAEAGGSAIGRTWLAIEKAVAGGGDELKAFAKYANKSAKDFAREWDTDASNAFMDLLRGLNEADNLTLALDEIGIANTLDIQAMMAMAANVGLVADAVERANTAYSANNALQAEFDAKAETTASRLEIVKNNVVEAGRSIGETMLPSLVDASTGVAEFAQKIAALDDDKKKTIVDIGAGLVAAGAGAKVASSAVKIVGKLATAFGALKAAAAGLNTSALLPLGSLGIAAGVGAGIGVAGHAVYKKMYEAEFQWGGALTDSAEELRESAQGLEELNALRKEAADMQLVIESPESSTEQIEAAKARIEEIAALLSETYHLDIKADADDIGDATQVLADEEHRELLDSAHEHINKMQDRRDKYIEAPQTMGELDDKLADLTKRQYELDKINGELAALRRSFDSGEISEEDLRVGLRELVSRAETAKGDREWKTPQGTETVSDAQTLYTNIEALTEDMNNDRKELSGRYNDLKTARREYEEAAASAASDLGAAMVSDFAAGDLGHMDETAAEFKRLGSEMRQAGADTAYVAEKFALAKNGFTEFDQAIQAGATGAVAQDFLEYQKAIGQTTETAVQGAALIKNGFTDVSQVINSTDPNAVSAVIADMRELGAAQGLDMTADKLTEMAKAMGLIGSTKKIEISAEGDISVIDEAQETVDKINEAGNVKLAISADGNITLLETTDEKLRELLEKQDVSFEINGEGNIEIIDKFEHRLGEIDGKTGTVTILADTSEPDNYQTEDKDAQVHFSAEDSAVQAYTPPNKNAFVIYKVTWEGLDQARAGTYGGSPYGSLKGTHFAQGTDSAPGGLAMVNDQDGIPDPRELIIDRGRAFIPEGRDVILPLSKGARVYTAGQTKAIMSAAGIPRYASGKDNSEEFTAAVTDWTHYINTHAVTTAQELEKWAELSERFKDNIADAEEIEEKIYDLTRARNEELNDESLKYIELRTAMNDWEEALDDPFAAYGRIAERNKAELDAGRLTWEEYCGAVSEAGEALYTGRKDQSLDWLEHEREYNNMSTEDYIAGLRRVADYTVDYYERGIIDHAAFRESMTDIDEQYLDAVREMNEEIVDAYFKSADNYKRIRDTFDDWDDAGDSEVRYYTARLANVERLRREGAMGWQEYMDTSMDEYLSLYEAMEAEFDEGLEEYRGHISDMEEQFRSEEETLRDSWDVEDRETDLDEVNRLLGIYENAATEQGQNKYRDLLEQKKQLERDEQLYQLEQKNNAALEAMEAEYSRMEAEKNETLKRMRTEQFNIFKSAENISADTSSIAELASMTADAMNSSAAEQTDVLYRILDALQGLRVNQTTYQDGRRITISQGLTESAAQRLINGTIVSGMGTVKLYH